MADRLVRQPLKVQHLRLARDLGVSGKRLNGWEPRTIQRGFDADGEPCPIAEAWEIVTETESEWDDRERADMRGLVEYERGLCECGWHESMATDKANHFTFEDRKCPVCAGSARYGRILAERDGKPDQNNPTALRPSDGRRTFTRIMTAEEVAKRKGQ